MKNEKIIVNLIKELLKINKISNELQKEAELVKFIIKINDYYNFNHITLEQFKSLKYFYKKLLTVRQ